MKKKVRLKQLNRNGDMQIFISHPRTNADDAIIDEEMFETYCNGFSGARFLIKLLISLDIEVEVE